MDLTLSHPEVLSFITGKGPCFESRSRLVVKVADDLLLVGDFFQLMIFRFLHQYSALNYYSAI